MAKRRLKEIVREKGWRGRGIIKIRSWRCYTETGMAGALGGRIGRRFISTHGDKD
jgi:hypothetical protein